MKKFAMIVSLAACVVACGCQNEKCKDGSCKTDAKAAVATTDTPVGNKVCPIGGHGAEKMIQVGYKGKSIGFCCNDCVESFKEMNEKDKDGVLAKAVASAAAGK